ncbi:MAG: hypothetical protein HUJ65_05930 [Oscillospiraceae bacterium]|nr:hypothetical protein [Oscillospiraceae bacterium]
MKPAFSNTFNVSHNKNKSEIALTFSHVYTEHNFSMQGGQLTDVSAQVCDDVSCILLTRDGAVALAKLMNKMVRDWGVSLD